MNILFVASLTSIATANYLLRALRMQGHEVLAYSDVPSATADAVGPGLVDVSRFCDEREYRPDLVLFVEGGTMRLFPVGLEHLDCLTAWYGIDTHMDYAKHLAIARAFDATFIAQQEYVERLQADGVRQAHWLPLAFAPELLPAAAPERDLDFAYVGSMNAQMHPERHALLTALAQRFPRHFIGAAAPKEMAAIYSRAKVVFNKSVNNDVNMRYFEALGCGAALVTDPIRDNGVNDLFDAGLHYRTYQDGASLIAAVEDLLGDDRRRGTMVTATVGLVRGQHTYDDRAAALIGTIRGLAKQTPPGAQDYFSVFLRLGVAAGVLHASIAALRDEHYGRADRIATRPARWLLRAVLALAQWLERARAARR